MRAWIVDPQEQTVTELEVLDPAPVLYVPYMEPMLATLAWPPEPSVKNREFRLVGEVLRLGHEPQLAVIYAPAASVRPRWLTVVIGATCDDALDVLQREILRRWEQLALNAPQ